MARRDAGSGSWVQVHRGHGPTDAYLIRDWLMRNGLLAEVRGESLMSLRGDVPVGEAWPTVWVPPQQRDRARQLIRDFEGPTLVHPSWQCPACGEENGPNFASCWSCGADRPDLGALQAPSPPPGGGPGEG
jgi:hypothetical protein